MSAELLWTSLEGKVQLNVGRDNLSTGHYYYWSIMYVDEENRLGESIYVSRGNNSIESSEERLGEYVRAWGGYGMSEKRKVEILFWLQLALDMGERLPVLAIVDKVMPVPSEIVK